MRAGEDLHRAVHGSVVDTAAAVVAAADNDSLLHLGSLQIFACLEEPYRRLELMIVAFSRDVEGDHGHSLMRKLALFCVKQVFVLS